jgi:Methyltransferase domain
MVLRVRKRARRARKITKRRIRDVYNRRYRLTYRSRITRVPSRNEIPALLNARRLHGEGAEIGVKTGKYSDQLLGEWRGSKLISIDPWRSADPDEYEDRSNVSQDEFERYYQETRDRLAPYGSRSEIWRLMSVEAAARVPDRSLDFVYIDARHDYESVLEDLDAWYPKVKPGGILAGHDYVDGQIPQGDFGVRSAVDEFFGELHIPVHGTEGPSAVEQFPSWIVKIPRDPPPPPPLKKAPAEPAAAA